MIAIGISATTMALQNATQPYMRDGSSLACQSIMFWKNLGTTALTTVGGTVRIKKAENIRSVMSVVLLPNCQKVKPCHDD